MIEQDITKTGKLDYRKLQELNNKEFENPLVKELDLEQKMISSGKYTPELVSSVNKADAFKYAGNEYIDAGYGDSMFDDNITRTEQLTDINDIRAEHQPWIAKIGSSLSQGTVLAGTTFLDGTIGLLTGLGTAIGRGTRLIKKEDGSEYNGWESVAGIWDNEVSNGLQEVNKTVEELLPFYRTEYSRERPWWENMGSLDFWADGFLKNMGFTVGALYSGTAWTKLFKIGNIIKDSSTLGAKLMGSTFSAVNEGRIEANQNAKQMIDNGMKMLQDGYNDQAAVILNSSMTDDEKSLYMQDLDNRFKEESEKLQENARYMGNWDLVANIPILMYNNFYTFGKMYARGFGNARNTVKNNTKKSITEAANEAAALEENVLYKGIKKAEESGRYVWDKISNKDAIKKGLLTGLREGNEELAQAFAAESSTNAWSYDSPDSYYKAITEPLSKQKSLDTVSAITKGFLDTYGNADRYEEFAIGALTGILGTPTFGKVQNSSADTYLGRGRMIGISGGIFSELSTAHEDNKRGEENVQWMNKIIDRTNKNITSIAQSNFFQDAMDGFARSNNKFEYSNMSDNDTARGIQAFLSAGREDDLKAIINQDFENMSDEELLKIAGYTTPNIEDSGSQAGWKNDQGDLISSEEDIQNMREKLIKKRDIALMDIDDFKESLGLVRRISNYNVNQNESEINELAWLNWKPKKFKQRIFDIKNKNEKAFNLIYQKLAEYAKSIEETLDIDNSLKVNYDELDAKSALLIDKANEKIKKDKRDALNELAYIRKFMFSMKALSEATDETLPNLGYIFSDYDGLLSSVRDNKPLYDNFIKGTEGISSMIEFQQVIDDLLDTGKLYNAYNTFMDKFNEYQEDPLKLKKNRDKIDKETKTLENAVNRSKDRNNVLRVNREQALSDDFNFDEANSKLTDSAEDKIKKEELKKWEEERKFFDKLQSTLLKAQEAASKEDGYNEEEFARIAEAIEQALVKAEGIEQLKDNSNEIYQQDSNGNYLSEEEMARLEDIINKATEAIEKSEELASDTIEGVENTINQSEESETTGHDSVNKNTPINNDIEEAVRVQTDKNNGKEISKVQSSESTEEKKRNTIINNVANIIDNVNGDTGFGKRIADRIYSIITEDNIQNANDVLKVLKNDDLYKEMVESRGSDPSLISAIKEMFEELDKKEKYPEQKKEVIKNKNTSAMPDTHASKVTNSNPSDYNFGNTPNVINGFQRATTETTGTRISTVELSKNPDYVKPYYETLDKSNPNRTKLEKLYNYLKKNNVFARRFNLKDKSRKEGLKIYFTTHKELNDSIGNNTIVILMSTDPEGKDIVGDLYLPGDERGYEKNQYLKDFTSRFKDKYNLWLQSHDSSIEHFVYPATSEISQYMMGNVMFTDSTDISTDRTLNEIFPKSESSDKSTFIIGVSRPNGSFYTSNQSSSSATIEESKIHKPKKVFTNGTPVVLVKTNAGSDKTIPVPFHMDKFNADMRDKKFFTLVKDIISTNINNILSLKKGTDTQLSTELFMQDLELLFSEDFHVNILDDGQLRINTGTVKENNFKMIYQGELSNNSIDIIINSMFSLAKKGKGLEIRVNRRYINSVIDRGSLKGESYNNMIGELAHTNLARPTTVNDYFIVYPLDSNDKMVSIKSTKFPKVSPHPTNLKSSLSIKYNGKTYKYTNANTILNEDGSSVILSPNELAIITAKAEIEKSTVPTYLNGKTTLWHKLANGNLFYNKLGEERIVSDSEEISEIMKQFDDSQKEDDVVVDKENTDENLINESKGMSTKELNNAEGKTLFNLTSEASTPSIKSTQLSKSTKNEESLSKENTKENTTDNSINNTNTKDNSNNSVRKIIVPVYTSSMNDQLKSKSSSWKYYQDDITRIKNGVKYSTGTTAQGTLIPAINYAVDAGVLDRKYLNSINGNYINYEDLSEIIDQLTKLGINKPNELIDFVLNNNNKSIDSLNVNSSIKDNSNSTTENNNEKPITLSNFDDNIHITITSEGYKPFNNLKDWSKKVGDMRHQDTGWHEYNGLTYYINKRGGRQGDNITIWFKNKPTDEQKKGIEEWVSNSNKIDKQEFIDALNSKENSNNEQSSTESDTPQSTTHLQNIQQETKTESKKEESSYPKAFNNKKLKAVFDRLDTDRKNAIMELQDGQMAQVKSIVSKINMLLSNVNNKPEKIKEDKLFKTIDDALKAKFRIVDSESNEIIDINKEEKWLNKVLPQLSRDSKIRIIKGLIKVSNNPNSQLAWGMTQNGIITLSNKAARGTIYHEAFHAVLDTFMSDEELEKIYNEGAKKYKIERIDRMSDMGIEENLAEDFRRYVQSEESTIKGSLIKTFRTLKHLIQSLIGNEAYINNLFYRINRSKFKNYSTEEQTILENASRDSEGNLLAPNGNISNLDTKHYVLVRTKAFKEWFGDWEKNPSKSSKVVDNNGEPLLVYHYSNDKDFYTFDRKYIESKKVADHGKGFYFSSNKNYAKEFGKREIPVFLNIRNLIDMNNFEEQYLGRTYKEFKEILKKDLKYREDTLKELQEAIDNDNFFLIDEADIISNEIKEIKEALSKPESYYSKFDGSKNYNGGRGINDQDEWVVINPNQIKSANENIGTFNRDNNDIRYRLFDMTKYRKIKVSYGNLNSYQTELLNDVSITEDQYNLLTLEEKENLLRCIY